MLTDGLISSRLIPILLLNCFALTASAGVQTTRPDPPVWKGVFADDLEALNIDFNEDGKVDFRLVTEFGFMVAYFDWPTRVVEKWKLVEGTTNVDYSGIAALPIGTMIGGDVINWDPSRYVWWAGFTNRNDLTQQYGDHEATVMLELNAGIGVGEVADGDAVGKEGVMAVEFQINGQVHYGYVHFDFRRERGNTGTFGYIYGWAYETEPGVPITAARIADGPPVVDGKIVNFVRRVEDNRSYILIWNAVVSGTYHVESSSDLVTWTAVSGDIIADRDYMRFTTPESVATQTFYRVRRVK